jgi:hypothetical protein
VPWAARSIDGDQHVLAAGDRRLHLPQPQPASSVIGERHRRYAQSFQPTPHRLPAEAGRHEGDARAAQNPLVNGERQQIPFVPADPHHRPRAERSRKQDLGADVSDQKP